MLWEKQAKQTDRQTTINTNTILITKCKFSGLLLLLLVLLQIRIIIIIVVINIRKITNCRQLRPQTYWKVVFFLLQFNCFRLQQTSILEQLKDSTVATLAAGSTQNWLQYVCVDIQDCTRLYHGTSANASTAASTHGHTLLLIQPFARTDFVLFDVPRRLSETHFLRLSSEATHCLYSNLC